MELNMKHKAIILSLMALVFLASIFAKQYLLQGNPFESGEESKVTVTREGEGDVESIETRETVSSDEESEETGNALLVVDVEGAVVYPGIVKLEEGSRVYEAVDEAGGMLDKADSGKVNLAEELIDGSIIYIPYEGEEAGTQAVQGQAGPGSAGGLININSSEKEKLMELPGIGETYAQAIIDYRTKNGKFKSKEEIKNVSGIGDATYEKLESLISI